MMYGEIKNLPIGHLDVLRLKKFLTFFKIVL